MIPAVSPGCCSTRTPTRSGCPTRVSRSSTKSSTSAPTPWRSAPTPPGSTWRPPCERPAYRFSAWSSTCRRAAFDVLAFNLSAELVYTNLVNMIDLAGAAVARGGPRRHRCACAWPAATASTTPSRWPISSMPSCSATARRSSARSMRSWPRWLDAAPPEERDRAGTPARPGRTRGGLRARALRGRPTRTAGWSRPCPSSQAFPARCRSGRSATWLTGRTRPARSSPSPRSSTTA